MYKVMLLLKCLIWLFITISLLLWLNGKVSQDPFRILINRFLAFQKNTSNKKSYAAKKLERLEMKSKNLNMFEFHM